MTESEWLACGDPDLLLEVLEGKVDRACLVDFVRRCWGRIEQHLPGGQGGYTVADQFAALAAGMSDHDAVLYASEGALKAARWCPDVEAERKRQAELLRRLAPLPAPDSRPVDREAFRTTPAARGRTGSRVRTSPVRPARGGSGPSGSS